MSAPLRRSLSETDSHPPRLTPDAPAPGGSGIEAARIAIGKLELPRDGCRIGVDLVQVEDVAESIDRFGERYLNRLFTEHELACCRGTSDVVAASLAARLAAKEAAIKVLRPTGAQPDWRSMEVVRHPHGACDLVFHARAAELAAAAGLHSPAVSMSHEGNLAIAVVIALQSPDRMPHKEAP